MTYARISEKPEVGIVVSTVIADIGLPASVCYHNLAEQDMCTIIPVEEEPYWILSCWGNGPGIACLLEDWDGQYFYDVEILEVRNKSVLARPLKPNLSEFPEKGYINE